MTLDAAHAAGKGTRRAEAAERPMTDAAVWPLLAPYVKAGRVWQEWDGLLACGFRCGLLAQHNVLCALRTGARVGSIDGYYWHTTA